MVRMVDSVCAKVCPVGQRVGVRVVCVQRIVAWCGVRCWACGAGWDGVMVGWCGLVWNGSVSDGLLVM